MYGSDSWPNDEYYIALSRLFQGESRPCPVCKTGKIRGSIFKRYCSSCKTQREKDRHYRKYYKGGTCVDCGKAIYFKAKRCQPCVGASRRGKPKPKRNAA